MTEQEYKEKTAKYLNEIHNSEYLKQIFNHVMRLYVRTDAQEK